MKKYFQTERQEGAKLSDTWPRCDEASDPENVPEEAAPRSLSVRYKHDHMVCIFREKSDKHPYYIYRDGGAAVNILHLAYYLCLQVMGKKFPKAEIHLKKQRPPCFQTKFN